MKVSIGVDTNKAVLKIGDVIIHNGSGTVFLIIKSGPNLEPVYTAKSFDGDVTAFGSFASINDLNAAFALDERYYEYTVFMSSEYELFISKKELN